MRFFGPLFLNIATFLEPLKLSFMFLKVCSSTIRMSVSTPSLAPILQSNFDSSNADSSNTTAVLNSFLSP